MNEAHGVDGTVYLLHFDRKVGDESNPHGSAQHYLGWASNLEGRIWHHRHGSGAALTRAAAKAGVQMDVVRTWQGDRHLERQLKNRKNARKLCPVCSKEMAA